MEASSTRKSRNDRIGKGVPEFFDSIKIFDVLKFVKIDLFYNDVFVAGASVNKQIRGVAIGGLIFAQLADAYCPIREYLIYSHVLPFAASCVPIFRCVSVQCMYSRQWIYSQSQWMP